MCPIYKNITRNNVYVVEWPRTELPRKEHYGLNKHTEKNIVAERKKLPRKRNHGATERNIVVLASTRKRNHG